MIGTLAKHILKRRTLALNIACALSVLCYPVAGQAQDWKQYAKVGQWTINSYKQSEASGSGPSCAAVMFIDHIQAVRIERIKDGYVFGLNGLSRDYVGRSFPLSFWFDGDEAGILGGEGMFASDAAYPQDDWLSLFHPVSFQPTLAQMLGNRNTIQFAITDPKNSQQRHVVSFPLKDAAAMIQKLDGCQIASQDWSGLSSSSTNVSGSGLGSSTCADGGHRLPGSKICAGRAYNYLADFNQQWGTAPNCEPAINEAALPGGDYLLYVSAKCGNQQTRLEVVPKPSGTVLNVIPADGTGWQTGDVFANDRGAAKASIQAYAERFLTDLNERGKCEVRKARDGEGAPKGAYVFDAKANYKATLPKDEPNYGVCGEKSIFTEGFPFFKDFGNHILFLTMGTDVWWDFDPSSLTIVKAADLPKS